jgi:hypothetical protein
MATPAQGGRIPDNGASDAVTYLAAAGGVGGLGLEPGQELEEPDAVRVMVGGSPASTHALMGRGVGAAHNPGTPGRGSAPWAGSVPAAAAAADPASSSRPSTAPTAHGPGLWDRVAVRCHCTRARLEAVLLTVGVFVIYGCVGSGRAVWG